MITRRHLRVPAAAIFFRQIAAMVAAGMPIRDALAVMRQRSPDEAGLARDYLDTGITDSGKTDVFKRIFTYLEANNKPNKRIADALYQIAGEIDKYREFQLALGQMLAIPVITLMVGVVLMSILMIFVIPVWQELFANMRSTLPAITQSVIELMNFVHKYGIVIIPAAFVALGLIIINRKHLMQLSSTLPMFRKLFLHLSMVQFLRYLAVMLHIELPLKEAATVAAGQVRLRGHARKLQQAAASVSSAASMSRQLQEAKFISNVVADIIDFGERSGTLAQTLNDVSVLYEKEADIALARAVYWCDIYIKFVVGTIVGLMIIAMYLPIFKMAGAIG